jgi:hypothetical protein
MMPMKPLAKRTRKIIITALVEITTTTWKKKKNRETFATNFYRRDSVFRSRCSVSLLERLVLVLSIVADGEDRGENPGGFFCYQLIIQQV